MRDNNLYHCSCIECVFHLAKTSQNVKKKQIPNRHDKVKPETTDRKQNER